MDETHESGDSGCFCDGAGHVRCGVCGSESDCPVCFADFGDFSGLCWHLRLSLVTEQEVVANG